ncbi:MAG: hypothetical protein HFH68_05335 [Lachnospiraceae bacterium]|nr:hypothetical protein [Lachnospiraceae bacterium]
MYDEYGLFAYGGYNGIGLSDFETALEQIINKNLEYKPDKALKTYSDLYRINDISCETGNYYTLDEDKVFLGQISDYIITSAANNVKDYFQGKEKKNKDISMDGLLDEAEKYEDGAYDTDNSVESENSCNNNDGKKNEKPSEDELDEQLKNDSAGGNPLKALKNLINNGLLSLVCDVSKVSTAKIQAADQDFYSKEKEDNNSSAAKFFKSLLEGEESQELDQDKLLEQAKSESNTDKLKYIYYAEDVLSSYVDSKFNTVHYGLEYLIAGKETEKENLAYTARRLLVIRTLANMLYVSTNASFQSKSLATATAIVGFTGIVPLITGMQWLILTILAFEEACIDVTALMAGKKVPLIKSPANFKMKYEEICSVSHSFFKKKGKSYPKAGGEIISTDISYKQYLLLLELLVSKEKFKNRLIDIIQFDLRERFNQTFEFRDCICAAECITSYNIPYAFSYINNGLFNKIKTKKANKSITASYSYVDDVWK